MASQRAYMPPNPASVVDKAIADVRRAAIREQIFEILKSDGIAVGDNRKFGFSGGHWRDIMLQ